VIELEKLGKIAQLKDKRELRDVLAPHIGRLVRLSYYNGSIGSQQLVVVQRMAQLKEVHFEGGYSASRSYDDDRSILTLHLSTGSAEKITPGTDTVEVFQEDSGTWKFLNRAGGWKQLIDSGYEV